MSISRARAGSVVASGFTHDFEPTLDDVNAQAARRPSAIEAISHQQRMGSTIGTQGNKKLTGASALTVKQSIIPVALVTCLFFVRRPLSAVLASMVFDLTDVATCSSGVSPTACSTF